MTPESKVVDSWALLAWLRDEQPGAGKVLTNLVQAANGNILLLMSWINAGEVYYMLARKHDQKTADEFLDRLPTLPIRLVLPSAEDVVAAAKLKSARRISYADGFAASLAEKEKASLITGDPELREMDGLLSIEWVGA